MSDEIPACPSCNREMRHYLFAKFRCSTCYWTGDSADLAAIAARRRATVTLSTTCARCSATIDPAAVEQHHERCFAVGDRVRWTPGTTPNDWVIGDVSLVGASGVVRAIRVREVSRGPWYAYPAIPPVGSTIDPSCYPSGLRHIQRPGQAVRKPTNCYRGGPCNMPASGGPCVDCGYPRAYARAEDMSAALEVDAVYVGGTALEIIRDHQMTPGFVRVVQRKNYECVDYPIPSPTEQPTLSARLGHLKHGPGGSGLAGPCDADCRKCQVERDRELEDATEQPAPMLYDGLTAEQCLLDWLACRIHVEDGRVPAHVMTSDQIAAAKALWSAKHGASQSAQLRARISAAKERERLTVRVDDQGEP